MKKFTLVCLACAMSISFSGCAASAKNELSAQQGNAPIVQEKVSPSNEQQDSSDKIISDKEVPLQIPGSQAAY